MSDDELSYEPDHTRRHADRAKSQDEAASPASEAAKRTEAQPRTRMMMSPLQLEGLQALWNTPCGSEPLTKFPTTKQREELAQKIGLTPRKTQVWFQNQRQKLRRVEIQQGTAGASPPAPGPNSPPSSDQHHQSSHPLAASSYGHHTANGIHHLPSSADSSFRRPSYTPFAAPPHPSYPSAPPPELYYPSYGPYPHQPPPPLPHPTSYFPRDRNHPTTYPVAVRPPVEDSYERSGTYLSPPLDIKLKLIPDEERRNIETTASDQRNAEMTQRDQEMAVEGWNGRRPSDAGGWGESGTRRGEGADVPTGWYDVAAVESSRRVSEPQATGAWSASSRHPEVPRHASYPGSFGHPSSHSSASTPRPPGFPAFGASSFGPGVSRAPFHSHKRSLPAQRATSSMQVASPDRAASPPPFSPHNLPLPPRHLPSFERKPSLAPTHPSPLSNTIALPSFRDFLSATSTSNEVLPSSLPPSPTHARPSYASSSSSSGHSYPDRIRRQSSSSVRGIGGASEVTSRAMARNNTSSSSTSSHPRSPTSSLHGGGNRGLPLPPPSSFGTNSSPSFPGLLHSTINESSSRSTLDDPLPPPSAFGPESYPPYRKGPPSIGGSSNCSSSAFSSTSLPRPTTPSLLSFVGPAASLAPLHRSQAGSHSDPSSSDNSATEKQPSASTSAETVGVGVESMEIEEEERGARLVDGEVRGARSPLSQGAPGLVDVAGLASLGRVALSPGAPSPF